MPPQLRINAVAYISPQNHPILIRTFSDKNELKYHYIAHTSLDVIEERIGAAGKVVENYLGMLYAMDDVAVYGYITALKVRIVVALALSDTVVRDADIVTIFKALHLAYYHAVSNPFLKLDASPDANFDQSPYHLLGGVKWKSFKSQVDKIAQVVGTGG